jgi:SAM-dependent methyltransferase
LTQHTARAAAYDDLASEYYSDRHVTCRNFDVTTITALKSICPQVPSDGLVLDVGAGKGRVNEFLGVDPTRTIQLDSSANMLALDDREESLLRVWDDVTDMPFYDGQFSCVAAFLFDPYVGLNFLGEVHRVLRAGGLFIGTNPSAKWGHTLRDDLGIDRNETRFVDVNGVTRRTPSLLVPTERLAEMVRYCGFSNITIRSFTLPPGHQPVSHDIARVATLLKKDVYELEVLDIVLASRV